MRIYRKSYFALHHGSSAPGAPDHARSLLVRRTLTRLAETVDCPIVMPRLNLQTVPLRRPPPPIHVIESRRERRADQQVIVAPAGDEHQPGGFHRRAVRGWRLWRGVGVDDLLRPVHLLRRRVTTGTPNQTPPGPRKRTIASGTTGREGDAIRSGQEYPAIHRSQCRSSAVHDWPITKILGERRTGQQREVRWTSNKSRTVDWRTTPHLRGSLGSRNDRVPGILQRERSRTRQDWRLSMGG
jgi:hypothetical protein